MSDNNSEEDINAQHAYREAMATDDLQAHNAKADRVFDTGVRRHPGFQHSVKALQKAGVMTPDFIESVMDADDPPATLQYYGATEEAIEEAKRLAALSPTRRGIALAARQRGESFDFKQNATPDWQRSRGDINNPDLSEKEFSRLYDKIYGRGGLPGRGRR
jgi:hypothetical protein